jgi:hypothetical protein
MNWYKGAGDLSGYLAGWSKKCIDSEVWRSFSQRFPFRIPCAGMTRFRPALTKPWRSQADCIVFAGWELCAIPLSLTLYGIDGRTIQVSSNETLDPDRNSFVWNLRKTSLQSNVYILKISAGNESKAQRIIATR